MQEHDVIVIGGGIVGLATARAIREQSHANVAVLEAEPDVAAHQSGHNSGVIHSGLYYRPGSLKARLCAEGRVAMYDFCSEHGIEHTRCGKLVVATDKAELSRLETLRDRGFANGLTGIRQLASEEIREIEPHASGLGALLIEETGIVDFAHVTRALAVDVMKRGGEVVTNARVVGIERRGTQHLIQTEHGDFSAKNIVVCAGVQADRMARVCGVDPGCTIIPFRGEYYRLPEHRRDLVSIPIYPVPNPRLPFLGVHFTPTIDGHIELGPNAVLTFSRGGYRRLTGLNRSDACDMVTTAAFWRMAARHWRAGLAEINRSWRKRAFLTAIRRLVPSVERSDLQPGRSGVRAVAVDAQGRLLDDFHIVSGPGQVHVLNAPSPAATASLAIGRHVAHRAVGTFGLSTHRLAAVAA